MCIRDRGKVIERKARDIEVFDIKVESIDLPEITMTVHCSKGTYIRTLCNDIGARLGCHGCMKSLLRVRAVSYTHLRYLWTSIRQIMSGTLFFFVT